jgi:hypothetical protein
LQKAPEVSVAIFIDGDGAVEFLPRFTNKANLRLRLLAVW